MRGKLLKQGAWAFLFLSPIYLLVAIRYFQYFSGVGNFLTIAYLTVFTISHFVLLSLLTYALLYVVPVLLIPNRIFAWVWAAITSSVALTVLYVDTFVFSLYRFHINGFTLDLLFGGAASQIFEFHTSQYVMVGSTILLLLLVLLFVSYKIFQWQSSKPFNHLGRVMVGLFGLLFLSHFSHALADAMQYTPITKSSHYYPLSFPTTSRSLFHKLGVGSSHGNSDVDIASLDNKSLQYPLHALVADSTAKTNVMIILIDAWYFKVFTPEVMPHLWAFSKRCEVYNHHYSGSNGTRTGVFSIFYSIPGIYWNDVLTNTTGSILVDMLQRNNYQIKTLTSASLVSPPFDRTVFSKVKKLNVSVPGNKAVDRDIELTREWMSITSDMVKHSDKPVFGFLFYDALHAIAHPQNSKAPFQPEWKYAEYERLTNDMDPTPFLNLYKNAAYFVDSLVGALLQDMDKKGMLKNTYIIISGDHGQEFNDNKKNFWGHNGNYSAAQMQVPFMVYKPGGVPKQYFYWTSHYDVVPTIFKDVFHCQNPIEDYSIGHYLNDSTGRDWLMVGSNDNFAILQRGKITSISFEGHVNVTDEHLNDIPNSKLDANLFNQIMKRAKVYYKE